jgi:phosphoribosylamine--glycine ligase
MRQSVPARMLVVGAGAREHALCWRLAGDRDVEHVLAAPGNPLMSDVADVRDEVAPTDREGLVALARRERVDLVVAGPEAPLVDGLADALSDAGVPCFGPTAAAAALEGSKSFARDVCRAAGVPMAEGRVFDDVPAAVDYARRLGEPVVVKANGLAGGKGVTVCQTLREAEEQIRAAIEGGRFGAAGRSVVVERFLEGLEASVIAICDRRTAFLLPAARDHKRLADGDSGPNTGGMGAYSPLAELDDESLASVGRTVHFPVLAEMERRGIPFRGALYAGLMLTADGPRVLEFNVRFGDPETQALLPRLAVPLAPLLAAAAADRLSEQARWAGVEGMLVPALPGGTVALTLAVAGYPEAPRTGDVIDGVEAARETGALVFGAGVRQVDTDLVTAGGRVLTIVGSGADVVSAAELAYAAAERITFDGRHMRSDIGRPPKILAGAGSAA